MSRTTTADPITVEVVRNYFLSTAVQMRQVLLRGSFNPIIYEMRDFSIGLYDANYELIAQDPGIPLFTGALGDATKKMVNYIGKEKLEDGDVILSNYAFDTGSHANDVTIMTPVFVSGEIFACLTSKAHWMDVGGKDLFNSDSTDIYQEGVLYRSIKIKKKGKMDEELVDLIRLNSRLTDATIGDLNAQIASGEYGKKMTLALLDKYGKEVVQDALGRIFDHGEKLTRDTIKTLPDGTWSAEGSIDDDGINIGQKLPIKLTVTIKGDEMIFDTTGSTGMTEGPMNVPWASTWSGVTLISKILLTPDYPSNGGCFRPIKLTAPEGSLFNPRMPAAVCMYGWPVMPLVQLGYKALAEVLPDRVVARSGCDVGALVFSCKMPGGGIIGGGLDECQGQGAWIDSDGTNALCDLVVGDSYNVPGEIIEQRYPFFVERYGLINDSGGPGKFRGGLGAQKHIRVNADTSCIATQEQTQSPAWGLFGGKPSPNAMITIFRPGTEHELSTGKVTGFVVPKGERIFVHTGGGGGWGDPYERDPQKVLDDVENEYVSLESARNDYGVVIQKKGDTYEIDLEETRMLRSSVG